MLKINGKPADAAGLTVAEYLARENFDARKVAVEINEEIVPKKNFAEVVLRDGDIVEIIGLMGGG
ncbi:MAG: sulfur carrier protein ThiS [Quinella sp. 2Q5]|nr:sulfur carrier protein ThiS [Quinella sp. 2Q5]